MTHLIIGTDDAAIAALRSRLRDADRSADIQLKSARDFDALSLSDAPKIYVVGNFPDIVAAYGDRIVEVIATEPDAETVTATDNSVSAKKKAK